MMIMRVARWLLLTSCVLLAIWGCAAAYDLPESQEAAEASGIRDQIRFADYDNNVLQPFFHERVMSRCVQFSFEDKTPYVQILVIDSAGKLLKSYEKPETKVSRCVTHEAAKVVFPRPPAEPFFAHFEMRFKR